MKKNDQKIGVLAVFSAWILVASILFFGGYQNALAWKKPGPPPKSGLGGSLVLNNICAAGSNQTQLSWDELNNPFADFYKVLRCEDDFAQWGFTNPCPPSQVVSPELPHGTTSFTDNNVSPNKIYRYQIAALVAGNSFLSFVRSTASCTVACSGSNPEVTINWITYGGHPNAGAGACGGTQGPVRFSVSGANGFSKDFCAGPDTVAIHGSELWTGAANNALYTYAVDLLDGLGGNVVSTIESGSFTTPQCGPTPPPGGQSLPDLVVINFSYSPANPQPEQPMTFRATVKNDGNAPTGGGANSSLVRIRVDVGNNGWSATEPESIEWTRELNPGQSDPPFIWTNFWNATAGQHSWQVCADVNGQISESNENNNCSPPQTFTVAGAPTPTFVLVPPSASILVGGTQQFDGIYDPDGPSGSQAEVTVSRSTVSWSSSNTVIATVNSTGLATGQSAGAITIFGTYSEIQATAALTVTASNQPDLVANPIIINGALTVGTSLTFSTSITNQGGASTQGQVGNPQGAFSSNFCLDAALNPTRSNCYASYGPPREPPGPFGPEVSVSTPLATGATAPPTGTFNSTSWIATEGVHTVEFCADIGGDVAESDENKISNCETRTFTILPAGPPLDVSCAVSPTSAQINEPVTWFATPSGGLGAGTYNFLWSGSQPLAGRTDNPAVVSYSTLCEKTGAVTVTSGAQNKGPVACTNTVTVSSAGITASPPSILPVQNSTLTWSAAGFDSCGITDNFGVVVKPSGSPPNGSVSVAPLVTTTYTLSCIATTGCATPITGTDTATITVAGVPRFREIPPQ